MKKISSIKDSPFQNVRDDSLQISKYALSLSRFIEISDTPNSHYLWLVGNGLQTNTC